MSVRFDRPKNPRRAVITGPRGGKRVITRDRAFVRDPVTGERVKMGLLEAVSFALKPPRPGMSLAYDRRKTKLARRIIAMRTGTVVATVAPRKVFSGSKLEDIIPGQWRDPDTGRFHWPRWARKGMTFKYEVTFRGETVIGEAKRDDLYRAIYSAMGMGRLTTVERARLWTGPSGREAAATLLHIPMEQVPKDFGERQSALDARGFKQVPFKVKVMI